MCGFAGLIFPGSTTGDLKLYGEKITTTLKHRGPDDNGFWFDKDHGLLMTHNRLSIHDLSSTGAQPMHSTSGRYCIVFNGEIYNYLELRSDLISKGYGFCGDSDTEVLLAAIEEWGLHESVRKFSGMFAFALWDKKTKSLHLCRDRLGEKPLYYGWVENNFYFASELHAINAICKLGSLKINKLALGNHLKYGYIAAPFSIYEGISKLPQSSILSLSEEQIKSRSNDFNITSYWSLLNSANYGLKNQIRLGL